MAQACIHVSNNAQKLQPPVYKGTAKKGRGIGSVSVLPMSLPLGAPVFRSISIVCNRSDSIDPCLKISKMYAEASD